MKINSSILYLNTQYNKISYDQDPSKENQLSPQNLKNISTPQTRDSVSISSTNQEGLKNLSSDNLKMLESIIEKFTGKDVEIVDIDKFDFSHMEKTLLSEHLNYKGNFRHQANMNKLGYNKFYKDIEKVKMDMELTVETEDGKKLDVNIELGLSQEFIQKTNFKMNSREISHQMVLNLKTRKDTLLKSNFNFEIDIKPLSLNGSKSTIPKNTTTAQPKDNGHIIEDKTNFKSPDNPESVQKLQLTEQNTPPTGGHGEEKQDEKKMDVLNSIFSLFNVWSTENDGKKFLLAMGLIAEDKIYLYPTNKPGGNIQGNRENQLNDKTPATQTTG